MTPKKQPIIELSRQELENFIPLANHVLLRQHSDNTMVKFNKSYLKIDPSWKPEFHVDRVYTVVKVPERLIFGKSVNSMGWKCDMDLQVGDRVWVSYLQALNPTLKIVCEQDMYILLNYHWIYLAVRRWNPESHRLHFLIPSTFIQSNITLSDTLSEVIHPPGIQYDVKLIDDNDNISTLPIGVVQDHVDIINESVPPHDPKRHQRVTFCNRVIMLNGYVLFELENPAPERKFGIILDKARPARLGVVRFCGRPNEMYREKKYTDDNYVHCDHRIHMKFQHYTELEYPTHRLFPWKAPLYVTQRRYIAGVVHDTPIEV